MIRRKKREKKKRRKKKINLKHIMTKNDIFY